MQQLIAYKACRYVYDGEFEGQMSMLHDTNKRLIKVSDIYPDYADLKKGDYVIRLQLRHEDAVLLDKMKEIPVVVERKLKEAVTVPVYATNRDAVKGGKAVKERALHPGEYDTITDQLRMQSQLCYSSKTAISPCIVPCLALLCSMCPCPALPCPVLTPACCSLGSALRSYAGLKFECCSIAH